MIQKKISFPFQNLQKRTNSSNSTVSKRASTRVSPGPQQHHCDDYEPDSGDIPIATTTEITPTERVSRSRTRRSPNASSVSTRSSHSRGEETRVAPKSARLQPLSLNKPIDLNRNKKDKNAEESSPASVSPDSSLKATQKKRPAKHNSNSRKPNEKENSSRAKKNATAAASVSRDSSLEATQKKRHAKLDSKSRKPNEKENSSRAKKNATAAEVAVTATNEIKKRKIIAPVPDSESDEENHQGMLKVLFRNSHNHFYLGEKGGGKIPQSSKRFLYKLLFHKKADNENV